MTEPYNISTAVKLKTKVNEELLKIKSEQEIEEIKKSVLKDYVNNSSLIPSSKNSLLEDINIGRTNADGMLEQSSGKSGTIWLMDYQKDQMVNIQLSSILELIYVLLMQW
ncbi:hypothetical protein NW739_02650 [Mycoplasmopsis felis]|uniref:hypothetical protein n=1 Tax=Mycoplasmopsis felis TaxID=33923 RepID=UPI0021DFAC15|nr:hypothetical protein [Mycoplasmopsis felis]MCU9939673.1 hypothetical protein [Mycoplasmopsis felis]